MGRRWPALILLLPGCAGAVDELPVCYDYGCKQQAQIRIGEPDRQVLAPLFAQASSAAEERQAISRAIGLMERLAGRQLPTHRDKAGNAWNGRFPGQMDCVDESTNTTTYLSYFQRQGWLRWHAVGERVWRAPLILDLHYTAVITEIGNGHAYAVDSWPREHARPAVVQALGDWKRKAPYD